MSTREAELVELLQVLFPRTEELHQFLVGRPGGIEVLRGMPGSIAPPADHAHAAVRSLDARAMVNDPFFVALLSARPNRGDDVVRVAASWGVVGLRGQVGEPAHEASPDPMEVLFHRMYKVRVDMRGFFDAVGHGRSSRLRAALALVAESPLIDDVPLAAVFVAYQELLVHGFSSAPEAHALEKWFYSNVISKLAIFGLVEPVTVPAGANWRRFQLSAKGRELAEWALVNDATAKMQEIERKKALEELLR